MENLHTVCELTCEERGSRREAKVAHVADVMRECFEDDCLLSMVSRADNQELEQQSTARRQSSGASYKNHEYWNQILLVCSLFF